MSYNYLTILICFFKKIEKEGDATPTAPLLKFLFFFLKKRKKGGLQPP